MVKRGFFFFVVTMCLYAGSIALLLLQQKALKNVLLCWGRVVQSLFASFVRMLLENIVEIETCR